MNFLTKLFKKKPVVEIPPRPSWETVVEMMYDKHLDAFSDEVVKVIYSKDRSIWLPFRKKLHTIRGAFWRLDRDSKNTIQAAGGKTFILRGGFHLL